MVLIRRLATAAGAGALLLGLVTPALATIRVTNLNNAKVTTTATAVSNTGFNSQDVRVSGDGELEDAEGDRSITTGNADSWAQAISMVNDTTTAVDSDVNSDHDDDKFDRCKDDCDKDCKGDRDRKKCDRHKDKNDCDCPITVTNRNRAHVTTDATAHSDTGYNTQDVKVDGKGEIDDAEGDRTIRTGDALSTAKAESWVNTVLTRISRSSF